MKRSTYQQFRKTGAALTSQSNYARTLVNRQNAAEDDYNDYAYTNGTITADQYITNLNQRKARAGLTPLQTQNLTQKIADVQETYQDSLINTAYKTGATYNGVAVDTNYIYNREKTKLEKMTPGSDAYNKQQALVDSYNEKLQKETRRTYRQTELNKMSTMRQETSTEITAKANMYEQLQAMAQADGEADEALNYETQKNNLKQSAEKAAVNERIQDVVVKNSTPVKPLSQNLSGDTVANANQGLTGNLPANNTPTTAPNGVATVEEPPQDQETEIVNYGGVQMSREVYDELVKSSDIKNYLERNAKDIRKINGDAGGNNGLNASIASQEQLVNVYKQELAGASADNKDTLLKGYNDAVERYNNLVQQRDDVIANVEERSMTFGDIVSKKAAAIMKNQDATFERNVDAAIKKTQDDFSNGKIGLDQYVEDMYNNSTAGSKRFEIQSQLYEAVNDGVGLASATKKLDAYSSSLDYLNEEIIPNKNNLRVVQADETNNDKINLATGVPGVRKGQFIIENPTSGATDETDATMKLKEWDNTHAQVGGVWFPVRYDYNSVDKELTSEESKDAFAKENNLYVYKKIVDGKEQNIPIKSVKANDDTVKYYSKDLIDKQIASGSMKENSDKSIVLTGGKTFGQKLGQAYKDEFQTIKETLSSPKSFIDSAKENLKGVGSSIAKGFGAMMENSAPVVFGDAIFGKTQPKVKDETSFNAPKFSLVKPAFAAENVEAVKATPVQTMKDGSIKMSDGSIVKPDAFGNLPVTNTQPTSGVKAATPNQQAFLDRFDKEAEIASQQYGIPKSVILAVAGHESGFNPNASTLFGIKGAGANLPTWEVIDGKRVNVNANFRTYSSTQAAFNDFAKLIATDSRYAKAYANKDNPTKMVQEIKKAGYATDPAWANKVNSYIQASSQPSVAQPTKVAATKTNPIKAAIANVVKPAYAAEPTPIMSQPSSNQQSSSSNSQPAWSQPAVSTPKAAPVANPALGYTDTVKKQSVMSKTPAWMTPAVNKVSTPKVSTPAPVSQPKTGFIDQAKNTVKNVISSISSWFKKK